MIEIRWYEIGGGEERQRKGSILVRWIEVGESVIFRKVESGQEYVVGGWGVGVVGKGRKRGGMEES